MNAYRVKMCKVFREYFLEGFLTLFINLTNQFYMTLLGIIQKNFLLLYTIYEHMFS